MRQPVLGSRGGALLGEVGVPPAASSVLPPGELGAQPVEQPVGAVDLVAGDHRAAVRQRGQRQQRRRCRSRAVEVHVAASW